MKIIDYSHIFNLSDINDPEEHLYCLTCEERTIVTRFMLEYGNRIEFNRGEYIFKITDDIKKNIISSMNSYISGDVNLKGCLLGNLNANNFRSIFEVCPAPYLLDLSIYKDERELLETATEEYSFTVRLEEEDVKTFELFEGLIKRNKKIIHTMSTSSDAYINSKRYQEFYKKYLEVMDELEKVKK